ncbi:hypothetical protein [Streptomyces hygroscopicus]|uniref:hypothetical protein n=1 Tax=Streptomyces hygroscopicus TaxID=1912 RepID=UPI00157DFD83|nr:hypothetical protein [Streptomyces hygroscopicus]
MDEFGGGEEQRAVRLEWPPDAGDAVVDDLDAGGVGQVVVEEFADLLEGRERKRSKKC